MDTSPAAHPPTSRTLLDEDDHVLQFATGDTPLFPRNPVKILCRQRSDSRLWLTNAERQQRGEVVIPSPHHHITGTEGLTEISPTVLLSVLLSSLQSWTRINRGALM